MIQEHTTFFYSIFPQKVSLETVNPILTELSGKSFMFGETEAQRHSTLYGAHKKPMAVARAPGYFNLF